MELSSEITAVESSAEPRLARDEVPPIVAPGPWIAAGALALGLAFDALHASQVLSQVPAWIRSVAALLLIALAVWHFVRAAAVFHRTETPFQPWRPARVIAAQGIYA